MSEPSTPSPAPPAESPPGTGTGAYSEVGRLVAQRVSRLQAVTGNSSAARALLAHLRHAVGKEPGTVPAIWGITQVHDDPRLPDEPTREERAAHAALTLFAIHQQSQSRAMHRPGEGVGHAVRNLATVGNEAAVRRRFDAAATATGFDEAVHHLRGLITQLRGESIPLDYGRLTDDLLAMQRPDGARRVRRRWGRDFYATRHPAPTAGPRVSPASPTTIEEHEPA